MAEPLFQVFIQSAAGSAMRIQVDESTLQIKRTVSLPAIHPWAYGFIIDAPAKDGDCLDCFILTNQTLQAGKSQTCRAIGVLEMWENDEADDKILATLPDESVALNAYERDVLALFLESLFAGNPQNHIRVGDMLSAEDAEARILQAKQAK